MASEAPPAAKKIKRTSFSPWNAGGGASKSAPKKDAPNPEPARIVSDILARANGGNPSDISIPAGLSEHPKILEMQREWERKRMAMEREESGGDAWAGSAGTENSVGSEGGRGTTADRQGNASSKRESSSEVKSRPTAPSLRPPPNYGLHKRPLVEVLADKALEQELLDAQIKQLIREPLSSTPDASRAKPSNDDIKARARRFTEEAVVEQMAKLRDMSHKRLARESLGGNRPSMTFPTPTELVQQMRNSTRTEKRASHSPATSTADAPAKEAPAPVKETPVPPPNNGDRLKPITLAEDGRLYSMYPKPDGSVESGRGCLFPADYKHNDHPDLPFICPVRSCRRVFATLKSLGGHFSAGHCSTTYNDNGDGTLSKVGSYVKQGPGGSPGIVISQNPLGPGAPPLAEPNLPPVRTTSFDSNPNGTPSATTKGLLARTATAVHAPSSDVYKYLHGYLHPAQLPFERDDIDYMLTLPRLRNFPEIWISYHKGGRLDMLQYSCALAFLVGREVTGKAQCQAHIRNGPRPTSRLSVPCIALPYGMDAFSKSIFSNVPTCVGCKYWSALQRRSNTCDWSGQAFKPRGVSSASAPASGAEEISDNAEAMDVDEDDDTDTDTDSDSEPEVQPEPEVPITKKLRERKRKHHEIAPTTAANPVIRQESFVQANVPSGPMGNADLEMEEWEVAPGRMIDGDGAENIAFSNSYLTSGNPIVVSEDVSFNVLVIKPGSVSHWNVDDDKLRTCSVASGKIKVTMGEKVFQMGPNGMFVVRPGQTCRVENRIYLDSVVHCTTIADFETQ